MRSRSANRPPARKPALIGAGRGDGPAEGETHRQQDVPSYHQPSNLTLGRTPSRRARSSPSG